MKLINLLIQYYSKKKTKNRSIKINQHFRLISFNMMALEVEANRGPLMTFLKAPLGKVK